MATNQTSAEIALAKQLLLERHKSAVTRAADAAVKRELRPVFARLRALLQKYRDPMTPAQVREVTREIRALSRGAVGSARREVDALLREFAATERRAAVAAWGVEVEGTAAAIYRESSATFVGTYGRTLGDLIVTTIATPIDRALRAVASASVLGEVPPDRWVADIAAGVSVAVAIATGMQIVAESVFARTQSTRDMYQWISVIDAKTSQICQDLNRKVFRRGKGPVPPAHPNCRSTVAPYVNGAGQARLDVRKWSASNSGFRATGPLGAERYISGVKTYVEKTNR